MNSGLSARLNLFFDRNAYKGVSFLFSVFFDEVVDEKMAEDGHIIPQVIEDEMKRAYLDYAMSVIIGRALPDCRDGLKPVHRRILHSMNLSGFHNNKPFVKCARIVGDVLGKFHPHGDQSVYDALVRMVQAFSLRYPLIFGQGNFGCFTKDTKVRLADGRSLSFEELISEDREGKKNYTFTIDEQGQVKIAHIEKPRLTRKDAELVRVTFDNKESVRCTPNHLFMLKDGTYKEAQFLVVGDSLMPLYSRLSTLDDGYKPETVGYELVLSKDEWVFAHHLADEININEGKYALSAGRVRHHKDFNKLNNSPENIERMSWKDHWKLHSDLTKDRHANDEEYRKKIALGRERFWSEENRNMQGQRMSKRNVENWKDETYRKSMSVTLSKVNKEYVRKHPELTKIKSERLTETLKGLWKNPVYQAKMHENIIKGNKNHQTNKTGKKKFLKIVKTVIEKEGQFSPELYEKYRNAVYPYGHAPNYATGIRKYFEDAGQSEMMAEACVNHKVLSVEPVPEHEDVYDLTVENTHNFALAAGIFVHNSVDGDNAAAYRYTEAKLAKISDEILADIDKETVDFTDNFDGSLQEPQVLPSRIPNLLINGSSGIAVGMATNIPPHNMTEVCLGAIKLIDNPHASIPELMEVIRGPDFPTGGIITGKQGIVEAYMTGRGKAVISSVIEVEEKKGKKSLVISEIPYQVNKSELVAEIADNIREKRIEGVSDLRDESDKDGVRVVLDLKANSMPEVVKNQVLSTTRAQSSFGIIFLSIVRNEPKVLSIRGLLIEFLEFRKEVVRRRTTFDLRQAEEKDHIVQGLIICLEHIDPIVDLLKKAKDVETARTALMEKYALSEKQAKAILDMRLSRLTALEQEKLREEHKGLLALIGELKGILASEQKILDIIRKELQEIAEKYGDKRKTKIEDEEVEMDFEDLIKQEDQVITLTNQGYIKRMPIETYKVQRRGGRGIIGLTPDENDFIERVFVASTHSFLMCFTDQGNVHWVKVYKVPEATRYAKGKAIVNLINLPQGEKISSIIPVTEFKEGLQLVMVTKKGVIKKTELMAYSRPRAGGIIAINLEKGDELRGVAVTDETKNIFLATRNGNAVKFQDKAIRPVGRNSKGVRGVKIKGEDAVIGMSIVGEEETILTVTENGYGKKTLVSEYRLTKRGGSGVRNIICSDRNGKVVTIMEVNDHEELIFMSKNGIAIRVESKGISTIGRNTQGMRIMKLESGDKVVSGTKFENETGNGNESGGNEIPKDHVDK